MNIKIKKYPLIQNIKKSSDYKKKSVQINSKMIRGHTDLNKSIPHSNTHVHNFSLNMNQINLKVLRI